MNTRNQEPPTAEDGKEVFSHRTYGAISRREFLA